MNVIVDTSVWSLALRRTVPRDTAPVRTLYRLLDQDGTVLLLGVILLELLQGFRSTRDFTGLQRHLASFPLLEPHREDYVEAARLRNHCATKGVQAGTIDSLIAAMCTQHGCHLLTTDQDFTRIARHSLLKLL